MKRGNLLSVLIVAMSLATAWAIRGQFGHEQGAAWAGAIGALALVLVSKRKDWYNKAVLIAFASAVGWGAGGMISYGMVVGYGRADNFINAFYGLTMLFVIGALFGLPGGGLVALTLDSVKGNRVKWGRLISEMVAGGLISYYFLIEQIGVKMTPPRSEAWAIMFGVSLALLWFMAREKRYSAIRVAVFSALGAGFGFAFGNFLQIAGNVLQIDFNMWNVMEYSIGFFGGGAMAWGVFSSEWPVDETRPRKWENIVSLLFVVIFIPLIVFRESLSREHFIKRLGDIPDLESTATLSSAFALVVLIVMMVLLVLKLKESEHRWKEVSLFFFVYLAVYAVLSYTVSGAFAGHFQLNHHLYIANIVLIFFLIQKKYTAFTNNPVTEINTKRWLFYMAGIIIFLALLTFILINIHGEMGGSHNRFTV